MTGRFVLIEMSEQYTDALPPTTRTIAEAESIEDVLTMAQAKTGFRADGRGGGRDG
jgi:hypothetical protein